MRDRTRMLVVVSVGLFMSVLVWFNYAAVLPLIVEEWGCLACVRASYSQRSRRVIS